MIFFLIYIIHAIRCSIEINANLAGSGGSYALFGATVGPKFSFTAAIYAQDLTNFDDPLNPSMEKTIVELKGCLLLQIRKAVSAGWPGSWLEGKQCTEIGCTGPGPVMAAFPNATDNSQNLLLPENMWHHVGVVFDAGTVTLYVNGMQGPSQSGFTCTNTTTTVSIGAIIPQPCAIELTAKKRDDFDGKYAQCAIFPGSDRFEGLIDNFYLWDIALTSADVTALAVSYLDYDQSCNLIAGWTSALIETQENTAKGCEYRDITGNHELFAWTGNSPFFIFRFQDDSVYQTHLPYWRSWGQGSGFDNALAVPNIWTNPITGENITLHPTPPEIWQHPLQNNMSSVPYTGALGGSPCDRSAPAKVFDTEAECDPPIVNPDGTPAGTGSTSVAGTTGSGGTGGANSPAGMIGGDTLPEDSVEDWVWYAVYAAIACCLIIIILLVIVMLMRASRRRRAPSEYSSRSSMRKANAPPSSYGREGGSYNLQRSRAGSNAVTRSRAGSQYTRSHRAGSHRATGSRRNTGYQGY